MVRGLQEKESMQKANIHACLACGNTEDFHPCLLTLLLDEEDSVVAWAARDYKAGTTLSLDLCPPVHAAGLCTEV